MTQDLRIPTPLADYILDAQQQKWIDFSQLLSSLGEVIDADEFNQTEALELLKRIRKEEKELCKASTIMSYNGAALTEYYKALIPGKFAVPLPYLYKMEDLIQGFLLAAPAVDLSEQTLKGIGSEDPRFKAEPMPVERIAKEKRIPVRIETLDATAWGYLELFSYLEKRDEETVTIVTPFPAIRIRDNYIPVNSVYRWFETDEKTVRDNWNTGKSFVKKVAKK